ncbi:MAG: pyridoxal-dependent decarboxylase, exosortase A system-associated [Burkholderiales bacterium]
MSFSYPWSDLTPADWSELAKTHGSPFYLFDADAVVRRIKQVREALANQVQVYYAVKANPNLGLLRALQPSADGVDISSGGELAQALLAGFDPARMSFAGPAKTDAELEAAISVGVGCISVESMREIDACASIADRLRTPARLLLRVNPQLPSRAYGIKMGGRPVQFAIDEEALPEAEARVLAHGARLELVGIHAYVGSQCFDPGAIASATENALRIAGEVERRTGIACRKVNLGGGFGVAVSGERRELDLTATATQLLPALQAFRSTRPECVMLFELGRFLTAEAGIYVTSVVSSKNSRGKPFVTCDGGLNHQLAAAGTFGAALRGNFPLVNLSRPQGAVGPCSIAGPSCNPTDLLGVDAQLAEPGEGDLLGVPMSGAYGLTASPMLFLGRDTPIELVRSGGQFSVGRRRYTITDFN